MIFSAFPSDCFPVDARNESKELKPLGHQAKGPRKIKMTGATDCVDF
jgi:hypothetical protein